MTTFYYEANSNAAPFFSDTDTGFVDAKDAMAALKEKMEQMFGKQGGIQTATKRDIPLIHP